MVELSVVVPTYRRPERLRRLLDALARQTLDRERWEVVVAPGDDESRALAEGHPVHPVVVRTEAPLPAGKRNAGWRAASAPVVLFTDDDCRPPANWLQQAATAVAAHPGAIVQGAVRPDPEEAHLLAAPHARTQDFDPPTPWAQTCNIAYPVAVLERLGGFEDALTTGEDTDLAQRGLAAGVELSAAPAMLTHHAVDAPSLLGHLRTLPRWGDAAAIVARHPQIRRHLVGGVFWKRTHAWLPLAIFGSVIAFRGRPLLGAALALPWARATRRGHGHSPRSLLADARELPARAVVDTAEMVIVARGAVRHRTLVL